MRFYYVLYQDVRFDWSSIMGLKTGVHYLYVLRCRLFVAFPFLLLPWPCAWALTKALLLTQICNRGGHQCPLSQYYVTNDSATWLSHQKRQAREYSEQNILASYSIYSHVTLLLRS